MRGWAPASGSLSIATSRSNGPSLVSDAGAVVGYHTTVWIAPPPIGVATVKRVNPDWRGAGAPAGATVARKRKQTTEGGGRGRRYRAGSGGRGSLADMTGARTPQRTRRKKR